MSSSGWSFHRLRKQWKNTLKEYKDAFEVYNALHYMRMFSSSSPDNFKDTILDRSFGGGGDAAVDCELLKHFSSQGLFWFNYWRKRERNGMGYVVAVMAIALAVLIFVLLRTCTYHGETPRLHYNRFVATYVSFILLFVLVLLQFINRINLASRASATLSYWNFVTSRYQIHLDIILNIRIIMFIILNFDIEFTVFDAHGKNPICKSFLRGLTENRYDEHINSVPSLHIFILLIFDLIVWGGDAELRHMSTVLSPYIAGVEHTATE